MSQALRQALENKKKEVCWSSLPSRSLLRNFLQGTPALVTFVTAGYPTRDDTVPILLAMEEGGADVLELGVPFSDPIADGPVIQETNTVCLYALPPSPMS